MNSASSLPEPRVCWWAVAVCGLIFALAAQPIARLPLWWDEGGSVAYGSLPVATLIETIAREDVHPPGYYLLLHAWMQMAGTSPFAIRLLSALCAPLTAAVLVALGRRLLPHSPAALLAASGLALAGFGLHHFSEARMYAPGLLLAASSFLIPPVAERPSALLARVGLLLLGASLHYGFLVIVLAQSLAGVGAGLATRRWRAIGLWVATGVAFALAYSPWLVFALGGTAGSDTRLGYAALGDWFMALALAATQIAAGPQAGLEGIALPAILISLAVYAVWRLIGLAPQMDARRSVILALALSATGGIVFASLFNYNPDGVGVAPRLGFAALPGLVMLAALGVALLEGWRRWLTAGSLAALMLGPALAVLTRQHSPAEDFRPAAAVLGQLARPGDAALVTLHWQDGYIESYAPQAPVTLVRKVYSVETVKAFLDAVRAKHPRAWIVNYQASYGDPSDPLYPLLESYGTLAYHQTLGHFELALVDFATPSGTPREIALAGGGTMQTRTVAREAVPGDSLVLDLSLADLPPGRTVFVHLGLPATAPIAQVEAPVAPRMRLGLVLPAGTLPGAYQVYLGLYDPLTGQRDALLAPTGCDEPDRACVGTVTVR